VHGLPRQRLGRLRAGEAAEADEHGMLVYVAGGSFVAQENTAHHGETMSAVAVPAICACAPLVSR
jgi:hypothetical protein